MDEIQVLPDFPYMVNIAEIGSRGSYAGGRDLHPTVALEIPTNVIKHSRRG